MSSSSNLKEDVFNLELRVYFIQYLVLVVFIALGIRFYVLQVARHDDYQARAENNRIREIPIPAPRGRILDRNEKVLVDGDSAFNVVVIPEDITDKEDTLNALAQNLDVDRAEVLAELNNPLRAKSLPVLVKQTPRRPICSGSALMNSSILRYLSRNSRSVSTNTASWPPIFSAISAR